MRTWVDREFEIRRHTKNARRRCRTIGRNRIYVLKHATGNITNNIYEVTKAEGRLYANLCPDNIKEGHSTRKACLVRKVLTIT